jgi:hypothetical protein
MEYKKINILKDNDTIQKEIPNKEYFILKITPNELKKAANKEMFLPNDYIRFINSIKESIKRQTNKEITESLGLNEMIKLMKEDNNGYENIYNITKYTIENNLFEISLIENTGTYEHNLIIPNDLNSNLEKLIRNVSEEVITNEGFKKFYFVINKFKKNIGLK